ARLQLPAGGVPAYADVECARAARALLSPLPCRAAGGVSLLHRYLGHRRAHGGAVLRAPRRAMDLHAEISLARPDRRALLPRRVLAPGADEFPRSEERRVGKEGRA